MSAPCRERGCLYLATSGDTCAVHAKAHQGPYPSPCETCGQPITKRDLWVRHSGFARHYDRCVPGARPKAPKTPKVKHQWDTGLGALVAAEEAAARRPTHCGAMSGNGDSKWYACIKPSGHVGDHQNRTGFSWPLTSRDISE